MGWVRLIIDGRELPPPTSVNWQSPSVLGIAITGEPVIGTGWKCTVSYGLNIEPQLVEAFVGLIGERLPMIIYPSPFTLCGDVTLMGSVASVGIRYAQDIVAGLDIEIVQIEVAESSGGEGE